MSAVVHQVGSIERLLEAVMAAASAPEKFRDGAIQHLRQELLASRRRRTHTADGCPIEAVVSLRRAVDAWLDHGDAHVRACALEAARAYVALIKAYRGQDIGRR